MRIDFHLIDPEPLKPARLVESVEADELPRVGTPRFLVDVETGEPIDVWIRHVVPTPVSYFHATDGRAAVVLVEPTVDSALAEARRAAAREAG